MSRRVIIFPAILIAALAAVILCADRIARRVVIYGLDRVVEAAPELSLSYADVSVSLASGTIRIDDIRLDTIVRLPSLTLDYTLDGLHPKGVAFTLMQPSYIASFPGRSMPSEPYEYLGVTETQLDSLTLRLDSLFAPYHTYLKGVSLTDLQIDRGHVDLTLEGAHMAFSADSICYHLYGPLMIGPARVGHTCDKWQLSRLEGNVPVVWFRADLDSLCLDLAARKCLINMSSCHLFADFRTSPKKPYPMPQELLSPLTSHLTAFTTNLSPLTTNTSPSRGTGGLSPLTTNTSPSRGTGGLSPLTTNTSPSRGTGGLSLHTSTILTEVAQTRKAVGSLRLGPTDMHLSGLSDRRLALDIDTYLGRGRASCQLLLTLDKACHWSCTMDAKRLDLHTFDDLLYPLVALRVGADVQHLTAKYSGDKTRAEGTFCMEYSDLSVRAFADSPSTHSFSPARSRFITGICDLFLPKANPRREGREPHAYRVSWKRDPMLPTTVFFCGPLLDGATATLLPGFSLHRRL